MNNISAPPTSVRLAKDSLVVGEGSSLLAVAGEGVVVPSSCCRPGEDCQQDITPHGVWTDDCYVKVHTLLTCWSYLLENLTLLLYIYPYKPVLNSR